MLRKSIQFYIMITVKLAESELNYANMYALSTPYKCQERFLLK